MNIRAVLIVAGVATAATAMADLQVFASPSFAQNGATRDSWLAASGILSPDVTGVFDDLADGNISGTPNIYSGLTITASDGYAEVTGLPGLMGGSNPIGTKALALDEGPSITLNFAAPIDCLSVVYMDVSSFALRVYYTDLTDEVVTGGSGGSTGNTGLFFGVYRNDKPQITKAVLVAAGGDNEWGIDNVEYSVVPEPASICALALGVAAIMRRRRAKSSS